MKPTGHRYLALTLLAVFAMAGLALALDEAAVTLDQVPPAVKDTILKEAAGAKITEIERETRNGVTTYEAEFLVEGGEVEIRISAEGALLGRHVERKAPPLTLEQVPPPARQALQSAAGSTKIAHVERERSNGVTVYEAEWMVNGAEHEAAVAEDGTLLETEEEIPLAQAPAAVQAVAAKHFPGGKVSVEKKTIVMYELEGRVNGRGVEMMVSPTGRTRQAQGQAPGGPEGGPGGDDDDDDGDDDDDDDGDDDGDDDDGDDDDDDDGDDDDN